MRIVQTFWTAGRDPLEHSFGWLRPEYNLMAWALSCLSLRKHYNEVALYTDERGKHVLIDLLHLPYTEVNVVYDDSLCLPQHWAYAKVKTYSLQTKPFLHVDGILLWKYKSGSGHCAIYAGGDSIFHAHGKEGEPTGYTHDLINYWYSTLGVPIVYRRE